MAIDIIPKSLYPFVPSLPGVPNLLRQGAVLLDTLTLGFLGVGDALDSLIGAEPVTWGVFDSRGKKIGPYESVNAVVDQRDARVSDYPVELGAFASYNKVQAPYDLSIVLTCGGTEAQQTALHLALIDACKSLRFYTVVTPTVTYNNVNLMSLNIRRTSTEGANMLIAEITGREIREQAKAAYSKPKIPASFFELQQGQVQIISDPTFDASGVA